MKLFLFAVLLSTLLISITSKRVVCYYTNWSRYQPEPLQIENIDGNLCTHIVYSFVGLDNYGNLKSLDEWSDIGDAWNEGGFKKIVKLKQKYPTIKILLGVGGWNEGPLKFQSTVRNPQKRANFLNSSLEYIDKYNFDGLEIDWIYQDSVGGQWEDKVGFSQLVLEMKPKYTGKNLLLAASTSAMKTVMENSYDLPVLTENLDYVNIMSYDFHGSWDLKTGHVAPLHSMSGENQIDLLLNVAATIDRYIAAGAKREKLIVGTVGYGRTFTLAYPTRNGFNSPTLGPGKIEPLPFKIFCLQDKQGLWIKQRNEEQAVPFAWDSNDQWVGYEDAKSLTDKVKYVKNLTLGGVSFFSLDNDDYKASCFSFSFPLLNAIKKEIDA